MQGPVWKGGLCSTRNPGLGTRHHGSFTGITGLRTTSMSLCFLLLGSVKPGTWPQAFIRSQIVLLFSKDESRIKATVVDVKPVDYREYGRRLVMNIRRNAAM